MNNRCPEISIVVTCYNYGEYINECLESILVQTFADFEIIVVDDGSTDNSKQRIEKYLTDLRLRYIYQDNAGQASAKNRGINESNGKYIAFLDADDLWEPEKLALQLKLFENRKNGVVYSRQSFIDAHGTAILAPPRRKTMLPRRGKVTKYLFMDNFVPFSSSVVRAECFKKFGGFDESIAMGIDWDLWLRISTKYHFDYVDKALLVYRIGHPNQMSKNVLKRHECSDIIMEKFRSLYPKEVPSSLLRNAMAFTYCNRGGYFHRKDPQLSMNFYLKAIKMNPLWLNAYKGLLKNMGAALLRRP